MKERAEELKAEARRGPRGQGGRGERRAREDRRDAGTGSRHGQAAPCDHQSQRAGPLAQDLVGDARVCGGRQGRLLLPKCAEVLLPPVWGGVTRAPDSASSRDEVVYETGPLAFSTTPTKHRAVDTGPDLGFSGADDGIRTRDPHLGNGMADVSCVSASLSSAPDLHVLGALVSSVSPDGWS